VATAAGFRSLLVPALLSGAGFLIQGLGPDLPGWDSMVPYAFLARTVPYLAGIAGWLGLAWFGARSLDLLLVRAVARGDQAQPPRLLQDLARVLLFGMAGLAILSFVFDQPITGLVATSSVLIAVLGFALRNMIADIFSGIALNVEHPYRIGDWIELAPGVIGRVTEINWRATHLITNDSTYIVVPNGLVAGSRFVNFSYPGRRYRASLRITLDVTVPVEQVKRVLLTGALTAPGILNEPRPDVMVESVNERGVIYVLRYWVPDFKNDVPCRDAVASAVLRSLHHAGLAPAEPKQQVILRRRHRETPVERPRCSVLLGKVPLFEAFDSEEQDRLSALMHEHCFPAGQTIFNQGDPGKSLFLIAEGVLDVYATVDGARDPVRLDRMVPGDVFGEMSLLTGQPRSASVVAATECVVYELSKEHIDPLLRRRPEIAEHLADLMVHRQQANRERKLRAGTPLPASDPKSDRHDILTLLRNFFRLSA
jgi:small-conductance mechanosensitive channel/CRP-like cAMP-binding protein